MQPARASVSKLLVIMPLCAGETYARNLTHAPSSTRESTLLKFG
jgi:hypothetical protein